jgi:hypothetical protein
MLEARVRLLSCWQTCIQLTRQTSADSAGIPKQSPSVLSFPPRLLDIARNEGMSALFGGWVPRTMAIAFGGAVFLGIYDFAVNFGKPRDGDATTEVK